MSGLLGYVFPREPRPPAELSELVGLLSGPTLEARVFSHECFEVAVAGRLEARPSSPAGDSYVGSFAEVTEGGRVVMACEGYVTNLRRLLEESSLGPFPSRGQALIALYEKLGKELLEKLDGGYLLVIWDHEAEIAVAHVCRFAQRNLYFAPLGQGFVFASELKGIRALLGEAPALEPKAIFANFLLGGSFGTRTLLSSVSRCWPGSSIVFSRDGWREERTGFRWQGLETKDPRPEAEMVSELDGLLASAVERLSAIHERHFVMMSSGVDSPLVAAYVRKIRGQVATVTQAMPGEMDESRDAEAMAGHLDSHHRTIPFSVEELDLVAETELFVRMMEEPSFAQLGVPLIQFSRSAQEEGAVVFSGGMAGHLFGEVGYTSTRPAKLSIADYVPRLVHEGLLRKFLGSLRLDVSDTDQMLAELEPPPSAFDRYCWVQLCSAALAHNRLSSQVAQHFGSEVALPFLDAEVVRFALSVPDAMKVGGGRMKLLLHALLRDAFPEHLRPKRKRPYWGEPIRWCYEAGRLGPALDLLSERRTLERGVCNRRELITLVSRYRARRIDPRWHPILWQLLSFEIFCRQLVDP